MDASTDVLAETVRAKRRAIDQDLAQLRGKLARADPRRRIDPRRLARQALPVVAGTAALWLWSRRRRRVDSLDKLLLHGLADLYSIEHRMLPALDQMRARAWNEELERAFAQHRLETETHIERLERVFRAVGSRPNGAASEAAEALIADGERLLSRRMDRDVRDAWLIATAQRLEHLEIANYGTIRTCAQRLGHTYAAQLLEQTLEEERAADEKLTHLATRFVNPQTIRAARV